MSRKKTDLAVLLLILVAGVGLLMVYSGQRTPFGRKNSSFRVGENQEISRVVFYEGDKKLVLTKKEKTWSVGGVTEARPAAVSMLMLILREMQVKSPVNTEVFREMITGRTEPVKVNVYSGWRLRRSFFVYRTTSNVYGNIMKMRVSSRPFIMHVPGLEEDIGSYFNTDHLFWQPFLVFNIMPSEMRFVEVKNLRDTASSYIIYKEQEEVKFETSFYSVNRVPDTSKIKRYLSYYSYVPFEKPVYNLSPEETDEIVTSIPLYIISAEKKDGTLRTLKVWEKFTENQSGVRVSDTDRVYGMIEGTGRLVLIRFFDIDPILRNAGYFLKD